jgi:hypothetical protein
LKIRNYEQVTLQQHGKELKIKKTFGNPKKFLQPTHNFFIGLVGKTLQACHFIGNHFIEMAIYFLHYRIESLFK